MSVGVDPYRNDRYHCADGVEDDVAHGVHYRPTLTEIRVKQGLDLCRVLGYSVAPVLSVSRLVDVIYCGSALAGYLVKGEFKQLPSGRGEEGETDRREQHERERSGGMIALLHGGGYLIAEEYAGSAADKVQDGVPVPEIVVEIHEFAAERGREDADNQEGLHDRRNMAQGICLRQHHKHLPDEHTKEICADLERIRDIETLPLAGEEAFNKCVNHQGAEYPPDDHAVPGAFGKKTFKIVFHYGPPFLEFFSCAGLSISVSGECVNIICCFDRIL